MAEAKKTTRSRVSKAKTMPKQPARPRVKAVIKKEPVTMTVKHAQSPNPNEVLYRLRTFVGWSAFVALAFAGLSMLSEYGATPTSIDPDMVKTSVLQSGGTTLSLADKKDVSLIAVGDIMLARFTESKIRASKNRELPFEKVKEHLAAADLTFANLESPFFPGNTTPNESTTFRADLESVQGLTASGIDLVSLANNHTMNYRVPGLQSTLTTLKNANIKAVGAGQNKAEAHAPVMVEVKGHTLAFLAYNDGNIAPRYHGEATDTEPGIAKMDIEQMKLDVAEAKKQGADVVIVSMHAGIEYRKEPSQSQKDFSHAAIDAGAAVVIGHHPHIVQGVERYNNGLIMYSLGNFVFDQMFSQDVKTGLLASITIKPDGSVGAEFFPTITEQLQPRILVDQERMDMLSKLGVPASL